MGLNSSWQVISGEESFFRVTKAFHNALQGGAYSLTRADQETYLAYNGLNARELTDEYDFIIVNDPQPAALRHLRPDIKACWIWRCHIDTSNPNPEVWGFLKPFIDEYDAKVFTLREFVPEGLDDRVVTILPAIDPLTEEEAKAKGIDYSLAWLDFATVGAAVVNGETEGFVKLVVDNSNNRIIGGHIIGHNAAELVLEVAIAIKGNLTVDDVADTSTSIRHFQKRWLAPLSRTRRGTLKRAAGNYPS